jgi:hypothetical protein
VLFRSSELAKIEYECGRISKDLFDTRMERTANAKAMLGRVDDILSVKDVCEREEKLWSIKEEGMRLMASTVCNKKDLDWETGSIWPNAPRVVTGLVKSFFRR